MAVLTAGGNAVDAAIAAAWTACVCEPVLASPGGGGFAMVATAEEPPQLFDFFVHTPRARAVGADDFRQIFADFGPARQAFHIGRATSAAPGMVAGLFALQEAHARASMADLLAPAIRLARQGFAVTPFQARLSRIVAPILTATPSARHLFAPGGNLIAAGETFANPGLADLFEALASSGLAAWRDGDIRSAMASLQNHGGHLRAEDFSRYEVARRQPLVAEFAGAKLFLNPLPAAGGVLIAHTLAATGDNGDVAAFAAALAATDAARRHAGDDLAVLDADRLRSRGTTHISIADGDGGLCALTVSNGEGNGEIVPGFGFMLNNMLGEEDVNPKGHQGWPANKRLSSMMCPTIAILADGSRIALGSGGSNRIRSAIARVIHAIAVEMRPLAAAIEAPRLHVEQDHLDFETGLDEETRARLAHAFADRREWAAGNMFFGGCHGVRVTSDAAEAVGDHRRAGVGIVAARQ